MELHNYTCDVCDEDFQSTELFDLDDEDTLILCESCKEEEEEEEDETEIETDDDDEEDEEDELEEED